MVSSIGQIDLFKNCSYSIGSRHRMILGGLICHQNQSNQIIPIKCKNVVDERLCSTNLQS